MEVHPQTKIGQVFLEQQLITAAQLDSALTDQLVLGFRLGSSLAAMKSVSIDEVGRCLSLQQALPCAGADDFSAAETSVLSSISRDVCDEFKAFPLRLERELLHVAMLDPLQLDRVDDLAFIVGRRIRVFTAPELLLRYHLEQRYGITSGRRLAASSHELFPPANEQQRWFSSPLPSADGQEAPSEEAPATVEIGPVLAEHQASMDLGLHTRPTIEVDITESLNLHTHPTAEMPDPDLLNLYSRPTVEVPALMKADLVSRAGDAAGPDPADLHSKPTVEVPALALDEGSTSEPAARRQRSRASDHDRQIDRLQLQFQIDMLQLQFRIDEQALASARIPSIASRLVEPLRRGRTLGQACHEISLAPKKAIAIASKLINQEILVRERCDGE